MARLGATFDATTVEPTKPLEILPPSRCIMQIVTSEMCATRPVDQDLWLERSVGTWKSAPVQ